MNLPPTVWRHTAHTNQLAIYFVDKNVKHTGTVLFRFVYQDPSVSANLTSLKKR